MDKGILNKKAAIIAVLAVGILVGRYELPDCEECPEVAIDTFSIVEYRDTGRVDTVYLEFTADVIDTAETDSGATFEPEILRADTVFADSAKLVTTVNEATNVIAHANTPAPIKIREITVDHVVTEIKEIPMPTPTIEKVKYMGVGCGIGLVVAAVLILL